MHVVYLQDHDGHKKNKDYMVEPTLGRRLCNNGVAIPYVTHLKNLEAGKEVVVKAKKKAESEKAKKLLKKKEEAKKETAISKKANTRSKAVKH